MPEASLNAGLSIAASHALRIPPPVPAGNAAILLLARMTDTTIVDECGDVCTVKINEEWFQGMSSRYKLIRIYERSWKCDEADIVIIV